MNVLYKSIRYRPIQLRGSNGVGTAELIVKNNKSAAVLNKL